VDASELTFLNPELRYESTPGYDYTLRVPIGCGDKTRLALNTIPRWIPPEAQFIWHYVRRGETLSTIAQKYRTTVSAIARANGLRSVNMIRPGQRLKIPGRGAVSASAQLAQDSSLLPGEKATYTIRQGDTLFSIARKFSMKLEDFLALNGLSREATIYPGQRVLVIPKN
jgi:membrane-bound lytic murein transglycosylase D